MLPFTEQVERWKIFDGIIKPALDLTLSELSVGLGSDVGGRLVTTELAPQGSSQQGYFYDCKRWQKNL